MSNRAIEVAGVFKSFTTGSGLEVPVLHDLSFHIDAGEFIMIQGQSGSGKSTLLNILNGWEYPSKGEVMIEGDDIYKRNEDERAQLRWETFSLIHQTPSWVKSLTVLENIAIPHLLGGNTMERANERAMALLKLLGFEKYANYRCADLSGGQQQRIAFLRGLVNNPRIIMADEPTGNLDSISTEVIMNLFRRINMELNRTIIMVTHNLELLPYADRVIRVKDGTISQIDVNEHQHHTKAKYSDILDMVVTEEEKEAYQRTAR